MEPLDAFAPKQIKGVVFDIDDTVTAHGVLVPEAYEAMHALRDAGITLVAITGRPLGWTDVVARMWPVAVAVGENGAGWAWMADGRAHEGYFATPEERSDHGALLAAVRAEVRNAMPDVRVAKDQRARRCDLAFDVGEEASMSNDEITQLVGIIEGRGARATVSSVHAHAIPGAWNKATGVQAALADALSITLADELDCWVFVGDSGNDAEAFAFFEWSVGVANVREHAPRMAATPKFVTGAERGLGFAELARKVLAVVRT